MTAPALAHHAPTCNRLTSRSAPAAELGEGATERTGALRRVLDLDRRNPSKRLSRVKALQAKALELRAVKEAKARERKASEQAELAPAPAAPSKRQKTAGDEPDGSAMRRSARTSDAPGDGNASSASPQTSGVPESPAVAAASPSGISTASFAHGHVSNLIFDPEGLFAPLFKEIYSNTPAMTNLLAKLGVAVPAKVTQPQLRFYLSNVTGSVASIDIDPHNAAVTLHDFVPAPPDFVQPAPVAPVASASHS